MQSALIRHRLDVASVREWPLMEKEGQPGDENRLSHWLDVPDGYALECLVLGEGEARRVYVVTTEAPEE